mmetsp:Transcript_1444/g.4230  ORF Transcript_1444/g.4230 Transcript_1444/m.4230 type:complete len:250 (-) Transcript_1444:323-1072(-)
MTDDEPCCRICFDTADSSANPLFRPCHCAGTSAWVHVECLDTWRRTSVNKRSFYECDACKFKYKFGARVGDQIFVARLLSTAGAIHALALCALASVIFVAGFVGKLFDSSLTWWDVLRCFNAHHLMSGAAATGLGSLIGWASSALGLTGMHHARFVVGDWFGPGTLRGADRDNAFGHVVALVAIAAGLCIAFCWIYSSLEAWARRTARHAQHIVLDVQGGRPPRRAEPAPSPPQQPPDPPSATQFQPVD